jgi:hypothetical protein
MPGVIGGVFFLLFLTAILLVIFWCKENDQDPERQATQGLFGMRETITKKSKAAHQMLRSSDRERT